MSAPEASIARTIVSLSRYFPVPTRRRDWNVRPPMVSGLSCASSTAFVRRSPASHEVHQLDRVALRHPHVPQRRAAHDAAVVLDHDGARIERERPEQLEQRGVPGHGAAFSVHDDVDRFRHATRSSIIRRAVAAGSTASHSARIAATPYAPAAFTSRTRSGVIRSEEHTSELQSRLHLVCRLLLEKKKKTT